MSLRWAFVVFMLLGATEAARAQAWLPLQGTGTVGASYVYYEGGDHLFSSDLIDGEITRGYVARGQRWYLGDTRAHTLLLHADYGVLRRLALSTSVAYVSSKYDGRAPADLDFDDGRYHGSIQDARMQVRMLLFDSPFLITPAVALSVPLREYNTAGHTGLGRRATEAQVTLFVGRTLAPWVRAAYVHISALYGIAERVEGVRLRRSSFGLEVGYNLKGFGLQSFGSFDDSYGGLDWITSDPSQPCGHCAPGASLYNRVADVRVARLGFGVGVRLPRRLGAQVSYVTTLWGENLEDSNLLSLGVSYAFETPLAD